jgi:hypothetical protein
MELGSNLNETYTVITVNAPLIIHFKILHITVVAVKNLFMFNILIVCL